MASTMRAESPVTTVAMIKWPSQAELRWAMHKEGRPRLLLIDRDHPVPRMLDVFEDCAWDGADLCEVNLRAETLAGRWPEPESELPILEVGDVLRYHGGWVALSPAETKAVRLLLARFDHCVGRHDLEAATGLQAGSSALNSLVKRLRLRLSPLGLSVDTVHGRGYVLTSRHHDAAGLAPLPA